MTLPMLAQATYIDNLPDLHKLVEILRTQKHIAFDTESNSLHAYRGETCLIQLSTHSEDFIIDPLMIDDISSLGEIFADPAIEKIFHAAEFDLICLKRDFDFDVVNIFDTMAAARVCGYQRVGLNAMLKDLLSVQQDKSHQKGDWRQRPLPDEYLRYAQADTHYLFAVRERLIAELDRLGRLEEAYEYFIDVTTFEVKSQDFDPNGFWGLGRPQKLTRRQKAILREIYILRDELAQKHNTPSHKLIGNKALVTIAHEAPHHRSELFGIRTLPDWVVRQDGNKIIEAVKNGQSNKLPKRPPHVKPPPPDVIERYTALHIWRKNTALKRDIYSDVIISKNTLWKIAYLKPQHVDALDGIEGIGPWRLKTYGHDLIEIVNNPPPVI
jgi:ribonuclease D